MNIARTNSVNFRGLLNVNKDFYINTDNVAYIDKDENGVFVAFNHSQRQLGKQTYEPGQYPVKPYSDTFKTVYFPKSVTTDCALKGYSMAAKSKDAVLVYKNKNNSFEFLW